jgi:sodium/hydrogen antiporter
VSPSDLAIVAALIFAWATVSARLERLDVTAPITFVLAGLVLTHGPLAALSVVPPPELVKALAEATLVLVLFTDASRVGLRDLRADLAPCLRLLGIGLPLTIGLGTLLALALVGKAGIWLALLVGAALAPTDAALGAAMMDNPAVPARIRQIINVESGLNDGIATPFLMVALAGVIGGHAGGHGPGAAVAELALGVLVGAAVGGAGGFLVKTARGRGWVAGSFAGSAVLALAVCAYASALALHANGFIAAFAGGMAFGAVAGKRDEQLIPFVEETSALLSLLVWLAFGAVAIVSAFSHLSWETVLYAVLSLTASRGKPAWVPDRLPRLDAERALAVVELPLHLNWSAPGRLFDLRSRADRARVYEIVLQEGRPADILAYVDGALLAGRGGEVGPPDRVQVRVPLRIGLGRGYQGNRNHGRQDDRLFNPERLAHRGAHRVHPLPGSTYEVGIDPEERRSQPWNFE